MTSIVNRSDKMRTENSSRLLCINLEVTGDLDKNNFSGEPIQEEREKSRRQRV